MAWAIEQDVITLTGHPVTEDELARAQSQIELAIGRTEALATAELSARDLEWLRRAVAYQAVWAASQHDLHSRMDVTALSQDGVSAQFSGDSLVLAPLARRAVRKLSWMGGVRSIEVEPFMPTPRRRWPVGGAVIDYESEPWRSL